MEENGKITSPTLLLAKARSRVGEAILPFSTHPSLAVPPFGQAALARQGPLLTGPWPTPSDGVGRQPPTPRVVWVGYDGCPP